MLYGDLQIFDIIIFAGIAIFLIFRLRNVLGKRTGFEKKTTKHTQQPQAQNNQKIIIPDLQENVSKLKIAYEVIYDFDHNKFLDGAKTAFETIINAFNSGDKKMLKNLVTKNVYESFVKAIDLKKIDPNYQFYSLNIESIESVIIKDGKIGIRIKFLSEQFKNNDESTVVKKQDVWTFEKIISSKNPNWLLAST